MTAADNPHAFDTFDTFEGDTPNVREAPAEAGTAASCATGVVPVSIDDGYAQVKLVHGDYRVSLPTSVRAGFEGVSSLGGLVGACNPEVATGWYETGGRRFTAGGDVAGEETRFADYHVSDYNRVAIHHALHIAGLAGATVSLTVGLPVADFYRGADINKDLIARKRDSILQAVDSLVGQDRTSVQVAEVSVVSQAVASWIDYAFGPGNDLRIDPDEPVAVVDIGGRTTDCAVVVRGESIDHARSGTENVGVLDVRTHLLRGVQRRFNFDETLPVGQMDKALRTGRLKLWGAEEDVSDILQEAVNAAGARVETAITRFIGSGTDLGAVLFVGGGADLFSGIAEKRRNGVAVVEAEFANVRGMAKYATLKSDS